MSQADIETLRTVYEALDRGDWPAAFRAWDLDIELETADRMTQAGTYRGHQEIKNFFEDLLEPFEEVDVEPQEFFDRGDQVVVFLQLRSRPKGSSAMMEIRIGHLSNHAQRQGKPSRNLPGTGKGSRSRQAVRVGDVAAERRDRASQHRDLQRRGAGGLDAVFASGHRVVHTCGRT